MTDALSAEVIGNLEQLSEIIIQAQENYKDEVSPILWHDELGHLRVWVANIGTQETGTLFSLDHRLRDASHLKTQTLRLLGRLRRIIDDIQTACCDQSYVLSFPGEEYSEDEEEGEEVKSEI